jgi:hypothetical protein
MTDQVRFEHAERVRDFYRNQGAAKERERIIELLMNLPVSNDVYKVIAGLRGEVVE